MHFSLYAFAALAATFSVVAADGSCGSTGDLMCCNSLQDSKSQTVSEIFSLFGGDLFSGLDGQVGFACSSTVDTPGEGVSCSQQTACCSATQFNGAVAGGCSPVQLS